MSTINIMDIQYKGHFWANPPVSQIGVPLSFGDWSDAFYSSCDQQRVGRPKRKLLFCNSMFTDVLLLGVFDLKKKTL